MVERPLQHQQTCTALGACALIDNRLASAFNLQPRSGLVGQNMNLARHLPVLFAHKPDAMSCCDGRPDWVASTALRNRSLQSGYLILSARWLGLDSVPMSGFNAAAVDRDFWAGTALAQQLFVQPGLWRRQRCQGPPATLGL
jgi:3-hydroxypropanoate dehydrogenase